MAVKVNSELDQLNTTDADLIKLAGLYVYLLPKRHSTIEVNDKMFKIRNTNFNKEKSGMDAMTVQNVASGEYHVVYMGTNIHGKYAIADIKTDAHLLTEATPQQLKDGKKYFEDMEKAFGEITSASGNSLGGALANYVGVEYSHVRSVTLNPAMLPASALDVEKQYDNITNYISEYDLLNLSQDAIGMGNQVPGLKYTIYNGVPSIAGIGFNHTGYRREDSIHTPYVTIGRKGEPGYGKIYVDAHNHIVSSIWTGQPLYGGRSERIDLNVETLQLLSQSIETSVLERLGLAQTYIGHTVEIINHESEAYESRLKTVREVFQEAFEDIIDDGLLKGIRFANSVFKLMIQKLHALLDTIERASQVLNGLLNSPPAALIEFIINKPIDAESLVSEIRGSLEELEETLDEFALAVEDTVYNTIEDIFKAGQEKFHDVVVGELEAHFEHVESNYQRMNAQVEEFGTQVGQVANAFKTIDQRVAHAITDQLAMGDIDPMTSTT
ncbi:SA1320 family protein, partial [Amphibacillus jilinensis]|uniref:SA1320 family protein n=1 Tax=Amphibacillus jilinensis TaxID=1216008 RepID=UPI00036C1585